jgi:hypothetical protein
MKKDEKEKANWYAKRPALPSPLRPSSSHSSCSPASRRDLGTAEGIKDGLRWYAKKRTRNALKDLPLTMNQEPWTRNRELILSQFPQTAYRRENLVKRRFSGISPGILYFRIF